MESLHRKLKQARDSRKGFTLIEMIVVLVIIGILATLMLGSLNGYIDKAKEKTLIADTRSIYLAAQTVASEAYANGSNGSNIFDAAANADNLAEVDDLSGSLLTKYGSGNYSITVQGGKVTSVTVTDTALGKKCTLSDGIVTVE